MDTMIVVLVVLGAFAFLLRRLIGSWRASRDAGCGSECGCGTSAPAAPAQWDQTQVR